MIAASKHIPIHRYSGILAGFIVGLICASAQSAEFVSGGFIFSDELGGFRILAISGTGTPSDPIVLEEEIFETEPVTLIIRRKPKSANYQLHRESMSLTKIARNSTDRVWGAFELELREIRDNPSGDADGLSFSQMDVKAPDVSSDRFAHNRRSFQPHDAIRFVTGHVNPESRVRFSVLITDTTPTETFYLVQDPQLLAAEWQPVEPSVVLAESRGGKKKPGRQADLDYPPTFSPIR